MKTKTKKNFSRFRKHKHIAALGLIIAIGGMSLALSFAGATYLRYRGLEMRKKARHSAYEDEIRRLSGITTNLEPVKDPTASWKLYENVSFGFFLKYPNNWQEPEEVSTEAGKKYLKRIIFKERTQAGEKEKSFEIFVYNSLQFPGPLGTDNLEKKNENVNLEECQDFSDITLGEEGYPAKEVNIKPLDSCYKETFFYSLTKDGYTLNIVPYFENGYNIENYDEKINLVKVFPEFYDIASTFGFKEKTTSVQAPRKIIEKAISSPKIRYIAGRSCNHKNDKSSKSDTKGKHMDEDCCPDPDEWPNPACAYSAKGLGIMISPTKAKKK